MAGADGSHRVNGRDAMCRWVTNRWQMWNLWLKRKMQKRWWIPWGMLPQNHQWWISWRHWRSHHRIACYLSCRVVDSKSWPNGWGGAKRFGVSVWSSYQSYQWHLHTFNLPISFASWRLFNVKTRSHIIVKMPLHWLNNGRLLVSLTNRPRNLAWIRPNAQSNRPRVPMRLEAPTAATTVAQAPPSEAVATPSVPQPCTPPLETLPAARPEEIPKELESLDPIIVKDLLGRPQVLSYLQKQPSILQNLNLIPFVQKVLLRNGQPSSPEDPQDDSGPGALKVGVRVSGLAEESREGHLQQLFCDINISPLRISLPRDSRCKKSCGTAFVMLESLEHAKIAVDRLNGARFWDFDKKKDIVKVLVILVVSFYVHKLLASDWQLKHVL